MRRFAGGKIILQALFLYLFFSMAGCNLDSETPLGQYDPGIFDNSILGIWASKDGNFVLTVFDKGKSKYEAVCIFKDAKRIDTLRYQFYISYLEGKNYVNLQEISRDDDQHLDNTFSFIKYSLKENNMLNISIPDVDVFKEAINNKVLCGQADFFIFLKDKSENVARFVKSNAKAFSDKKVINLYRMKPIQK